MTVLKIIGSIILLICAVLYFIFFIKDKDDSSEELAPLFRFNDYYVLLFLIFIATFLIASIFI